MTSIGDNVFNGARQFMHRWDFFARREAPSAMGMIRVASKTSQAGNINIGGTEFSSASVMYVPSQDGFMLAIEPGVRDLVTVIACEMNVITYTSCEGHFYADGRKPDPRCVGALPRDPTEQEALTKLFGSVVSDWNADRAGCAVTAQLIHRQLVDRAVCLPVLDLLLVRSRDCSWREYFEVLDECTESFVSLLRSRALAVPRQLIRDR